MAPERVSLSPDAPARKPVSALRVVIALLLVIVALSYIAAILSGTIHGDERLDAATMAIIAIVAVIVLVLLQPDLLSRFKTVEMSGFKIEMLEKVRERQAEQAVQLEDMALMLPLLLPAAERKHLLNLSDGKTSNYVGAQSLRSELRRLRTLGLLQMRGDRKVEMMRDGMKFDLADYLQLTELGKRWSKRIKEIEQREPQDEEEA